jgi:serine/threonine-protein kinase
LEFGIGDTAGDYRVIGVLGTGGMGTVYKVQHLISDRIEAMKVIRPDRMDSPELADRFIREIRVQARLNHPHIASLHNAIRWEDHFLMIMEYVDGAALSTFLRRGALNLADSVHITLQALSALAYAHSQGVVHRDIKPANIIITPDGTAKLMDFGIARSLADHVHLTQTGAVVGSFHYMSPEQIRGAAIDGRSDLYSTGIMLYEMVTGVRPITGDSSWNIMNAHMSQVPRAPAMLNTALPAPFSLAILKAIEKDPAERYQTAGEFAQMLTALQARYSQLAYSVPAASPEPRSSPSKEFPPRREPVEIPLTEVAPREPAKESVAPHHPAVEVVTPTPAHHSTPTPSTPHGGTTARGFDSSELEPVKRELAIFLGPMARIIVDRAARKATSWRQLYDILAQEVPAGDERKRFLAKRPR